MSRIAYVNGRYLPHRTARVHIEDRGYQFADGIYEVIAVVNRRLLDGEPHFDRLEHSLAAVRIAAPMSRPALTAVAVETIRRNRVDEGFLYLQVTRGVAPREHAFPAAATPSLVMTARARRFGHDPEALTGGSAVTTRDIRWERCDIKSIALLPNVLAKQQAVEAGAHETLMVDDDGFVTEGSSANAWILDREGRVITRGADHAILNGITRQSLIRLARAAGIAVEERPFTVAEAKAAREAFITSTSQWVKPITEIDGTVIGNGAPGETARRLFALYLTHARTACPA